MANKEKKPDELIDYDIEELKEQFNGNDLIDLEKKAKENETYARLFLFLGDAFFKKKLTVIDRSQTNSLVLKTYDYTSKVLDVLSNHGLLDKIKTRKKNLYALKDPQLLKYLIPIAKETILTDKKIKGKDV